MSRTGPVTKDTSTVALGLAQIRVGSASANIALIAPQLDSDDSIGALASTKFTGTVDYWKLESGFPMLEDLTLPIREASMLECEFKEITPYNLALARGIDPLDDIPATATKGTVVSTSGTIVGDITVTDTAGPVTENYTVFFTGATAGDIIGSVSGLVESFVAVTGAIEPDNGGNPYFSLPANFFSGTWAADDSYTFSCTAFVAGSSAYTDPHAGEIKLGALTAPAYVRMEAVYTYPDGSNTMTIIFPRANCTTSVEIDLQSEDNANVPLTFEAKRADSETTGGNAVWDSMTLGRIVFA